jgi:quercetin dioxygenase-like cupin family protein
LEKITKGAAEAEMLLPPDLETALEGAIIRIQPGKKLTRHFFVHKGEEVGYLVTGRLEVTIDNHSYEVTQGDTLYLPKDTPSLWHNTGEGVAELIWFKI